MKDNKRDILIKLIEQGDNLPTIRKISQMTDIKYANVYNIIKKLEQENIIDLEKTGNAYRCMLIKKPDPLIFSAEYERRDLLTENSDFKVLQQKLNFLPFPFIALLFGSHAKGTALKQSDIDLMVIAEEKTISEMTGQIKASGIIALILDVLNYLNLPPLEKGLYKKIKKMGYKT
jgi:predicted nucleotidyltransferase